MKDNIIEEFDEYIVINGVQINKPLVEKPVDAEGTHTAICNTLYTTLNTVYITGAIITNIRTYAYLLHHI